MKYKGLKKTLLAVLLTSLPLVAADDFDVEKSLVGIEAGYGNISSDTTTPTTYTSNDTKFASIGLKIGAESEHYRITLGARYEKDNDSIFDYITNYEVEGDYLFNFSKMANFFIGAHAGWAYMKFTVPTELYSRTISNSYYGGNLGFNIHATKNVDLELGSRISLLDASNIKNNVEYKFNNQTMGYFSVIFKYNMD